MNKITLENIQPEDHKYIKLHTRLILPNEQARYIAEVVYEDGWGASQILCRSVSSVLDEAIENVISVSGMKFLRK